MLKRNHILKSSYDTNFPSDASVCVVMVLETSVLYIAREDFIAFSRRDSYRSYEGISKIFRTGSITK